MRSIWMNFFDYVFFIHAIVRYWWAAYHVVTYRYKLNLATDLFKANIFYSTTAHKLCPIIVEAFLELTPITNWVQTTASCNAFRTSLTRKRYWQSWKITYETQTKRDSPVYWQKNIDELEMFIDRYCMTTQNLKQIFL